MKVDDDFCFARSMVRMDPEMDFIIRMLYQSVLLLKLLIVR